MKLLIISDTHCGVRNSSQIFMDYQEEVYSKEIFPYMEEHGIDTIIHGGDYYDHRKYINFQALNRNRSMFLNVLRERGYYMHIIPGNHDVYYKSTNELCSLKELQGYYTDCVKIHMNPTVVDFEGCSIAMLPWIHNNNYAESIDFIQKCKAAFLMGHLELNGFEMMRGVKNTHGMDAKLFHRFEQVWSGHYHTKSSQGNIHYLGAQFEFNWGDCDDPKYFHVFDTETRELTSVRVETTIFSKVVYDDEKYDYSNFDFTQFDNKFVKVVVSKKTDPYEFDRFIDKIQDRAVHELKIAETFNEFLGENVEGSEITVEDTTVLLDQYIDAVETSLDKDRVKSMMRSLFAEAVNLEIA